MKEFGLILIGGVGVAFLILGYLLWKKERISLLHEYHRNFVRQEDRRAFCAWSGWGLLAIGLSLIATAVTLGFTDSAWSFSVFAVGMTMGLALLRYAGKRYRRPRN